MRQVKNAFQAAIQAPTDGPFFHDVSRLGWWPLNAQLLVEREEQDALRLGDFRRSVQRSTVPSPCHKHGGRRGRLSRDQNAWRADVSRGPKPPPCPHSRRARPLAEPGLDDL